MTHAALRIDGVEIVSLPRLADARHDACVLIDGKIHALAVWYSAEETAGNEHWCGYVHIPRLSYVPQILTLGGMDVTYVGNGSNRIQWMVHSNGQAIPVAIDPEARFGDFWIGFDMNNGQAQPSTAQFIESKLMPFARAAHEVFVA